MSHTQPASRLNLLTHLRHVHLHHGLVDAQRRPSIAILVADGVDEIALAQMEAALAKAGVRSSLVAPHGGVVVGMRKMQLRVAHRLETIRPTMFDALFIPGGSQSIAALRASIEMRCFIADAHRHGKHVAGTEEAYDLLIECAVHPVQPHGEGGDPLATERVRATTTTSDFVKAIFSDRSSKTRPPVM